jgi:hypothetical protein
MVQPAAAPGSTRLSIETGKYTRSRTGGTVVTDRNGWRHLLPHLLQQCSTTRRLAIARSVTPRIRWMAYSPTNTTKGAARMEDGALSARFCRHGNA